ncbi:trichohyalin-like [Pollicipes pollicipes]|uniref:trichohyalin-like n=1 Tax=Pollicipes pollicipes TaxID=41117 RepID=UPI0018855E69|nr:trichohyalin-like [Pollicipes pollicipes]
MPVSSNFSMEVYNGRDRGRRSSESSSASDATRERLRSAGGVKKQVSADSTENIPTRRVSVGPKPAANPMKFVAAGPTPLLRTASEQMLKAEKLRMAAKPAVKEEESAAWQNNLDNWKSSRRKRQEDVIERLTEVKKMEEIDHDRSRRRAKTFGEMMQDRSGKGRRMLQVFTDDDNDISGLLTAKSPASSDTKSDLGFATSSDTGSEPSDNQEAPVAGDGSFSKPAEPAPVTAPVVRSIPAEPAVLEPAPVSWEDPSHAVDQMEAQILRQLEESERTQMSAGEMPAVLDFPLQPSAAPPPSEKPPPPPPISDDDEPTPEARPAKSTTTVKKDLYRRRSDFLGIQGKADYEPTPAVSRPPDMEALLRQERAQQQDQERRRQAAEQSRRREQARRESLRRAEEEAEARAEEFRRRAQQEQEQREQERRALEVQQQEEQRLEQERRSQEQLLEQERRSQEQLLEQERRSREQLLEQQRRAQEEQEQDWRRRSVQTAEPSQERWAQEQLSDQEREWRRRKEQLSEEEVDRQEREIMESLEQEESWRYHQQIKYQSRLAKMQAAEQSWQQTQECPPGERRSADLFTSREQARSNPNLLQEAPAPLAPSRSYGDLQAPAPAPLQQSRAVSSGRP